MDEADEAFVVNLDRRDSARVIVDGQGAGNDH